jgi:hypothetical protein
MCWAIGLPSHKYLNKFMGSPDWSKIPFDKMPEWKRQEIINQNKQVDETIKQIENELKCEVCGKVCKNKSGLKAHLRSHNN